MTDTELFADIASLLYGPRWQTELARVLGKDSRTIRRYASEDSPIPTQVWEELKTIVEAHMDAIKDVRRLLDFKP